MSNELLRLTHVEKRMGGQAVLNGLSLYACEGEVIDVLCASQGVGDSIINLIGGATKPDSGKVLYQGNCALPEPDTSWLQIVDSQPRLIAQMSVLDNITAINGQPKGAFFFLRRAGRREALQREFAAYGLQIDAGRPVESYTPAERQAIEIVRGALLGMRVLIMRDLMMRYNEAERERLLRIIQRLRANGVGIINLTAQLSGRTGMADRIYLLGKGKVSSVVYQNDSITDEKFASVLSGSEATRVSERPRGSTGEFLSLHNIKTERMPRPLSLAVCEGECLGLIDKEGEDATEIGRLIGGERPYSGEVRVGGRPVRLGAVYRAQRLGICMVHDKPLGGGLVRGLNELDSLTLLCYSRISRFSLLQRRKQHYLLNRTMGIFREIGLEMRPLSRYKAIWLMIARCVISNPRLLLLLHSFEYLDDQERVALQKLILILKERGTTTVIVEHQTEDCQRVCDRILTLSEAQD